MSQSAISAEVTEETPQEVTEAVVVAVDVEDEE